MAQMAHRLSLLSYWSIHPGSRVLEIGCGQGDTTIVLADAVGPTGHVDAIDPGDPTYGSPYTLGQSQSHILSSPLGPRITFHNTTPQKYLAEYEGERYDVVVFSHSIYYFSGPEVLPEILVSLKGKAKRACVAEWALKAGRQEGQAHLLAVLLLGALESKRGIESEENVRCVRSPRAIREIFEKGGWRIEREDGARETGEGMHDGKWEVGALLRKKEKLMEEMRGVGVGEKEEVWLEGAWDALRNCVDGYVGGVEGVKCMDHWACVFEQV